MSIYVEKIDKATPAQGNILNSPSSMSETDALSIEATINAIPPPLNKLINGDFQCNQRGQSEYQISSLSSAYTLDMWRLYCRAGSTAKAIKTNNVIRIESTGNEVQFFQEIKETSEKLRVSVKLISTGSNVKLSTFYPNGEWIDIDKKLEVGINSFVINNENVKRVGLRIYGNSIVEIEYIDLFEGDIAFPHVKEDYSIALLRCKKYINKIKYSCPISFEYETNNNYICYVPFVLMDKLPSIIKCEYSYFDVSNNNIYGSSYYDLLIRDSFIQFTTMSGIKIHRLCHSIVVTLIISCEPL